MRSKFGNSAGWYAVGNVKSFYRSKMEKNFAFYLEFLKSCGLVEKWEHEPEMFKLEGRMGVVSHYKPDFRAVGCEGDVKWYEVKGWLDKRSQAKINAFRKQYPKLNLTVVDKKWFNRNTPKLKGLIREWT